MDVSELSLIGKALGDPHRLQIVQLLAEGEKCACQLLEEFHITQPTLSHHMRILCDSGLVNVRREGKWSHYSLNSATLNSLRRFVNMLSSAAAVGDESRCRCS